MNGVYSRENQTFTPINPETSISTTNYSLPGVCLGKTTYVDSQRTGDHQGQNAQAPYRSAENLSRVEDSMQLSHASQRDVSDTNQSSDELSPASIFFFSSNSTFHGLSHFVHPGKVTVRRLLWGVAFFTSFFGLLTQGYDRYSYYISHPHVTKLDEQEAMIMIFPVVTLCNMNRFRRSKITTNDYYYVGSPLFDLFDSNYNLKKGFRDNRTWPDIKTKISPILDQGSDYRPMLDFNMREFYDRTGHDLNGIVKACKYRGKKCKPNSWLLTFTRYGKCYTFNTGKTSRGENVAVLRTPKGGVDNGLELLLDTEQDEYMPVWAETDEISIEAGFKVQIHTQTEPPFIHELGFGIAPGFQTLVATQEQRITFLPDPYGDCESGKNKNKFQPFDNYSISACRISCETKYVMNECQCRMIHMPGTGRFCSPEEYKSCADRKLDYLVNLDEKICVCGTPCEVIRYNLEMSTLQLPSTQAVGYLASKYGKEEDYVRNNFVKLNIFFEALNYETIQQKKAYELPGLFGDIGGQMGLFIGASILTILELFDYMYEVVKDKTWGRKQRKERNQRLTLEEQKTNVTNADGMNLQEPEHNHTPSYETRLNDKRPYTSYSHLHPLPEYKNVRKRQVEPQHVTSTLELDHRPNSQFLGNSYSVHRSQNAPEGEKQDSSFFYSPTTFHYPAAERNRETSMSYNDLFRPSATTLAASEHANGVIKPRLNFHTTGYTLPLTPMTTGRQSRPNEGLFLDADFRRQLSVAPTGSPPRINLSELPDFSISTKETEIH